MSELVVDIRDLTHTYLRDTPMAVTALQQASLALERHHIAALVGPGGAGKSTLAHFFNGLIRPSHEGLVSVLGQDTADPACDLMALRRRVGLVFQYPYQQMFERYVGDDVAYGPRELGLSREEVRERVRWAMEEVGLPFDAFVDRFTFSLSGGRCAAPLWRVCWPCVPRSWCSMRPPPGSIRRGGAKCTRCYGVFATSRG